MSGWLRSGSHGVLVLVLFGPASCSTVDPGQNFQFAEVIFDENFFYCRVEPMLFAQRCGPGDPAKQDPMGGCHFSTVTGFNLADYDPKVSESCSGNNPSPAAVIPDEARSNYQSAQRQMRVDPDQAPLLAHPTRRRAHPREVFPFDSEEADVIREWATRFASQ